jgi:hypothetical protein
LNETDVVGGLEEATSLPVRCEVQRAGGRGLVRAAEIVFLLGPLFALGRALGRALCGYARSAEVTALARQIVIRERLSVFGREVRVRTVTLDPESLAEIVFRTPHNDLIWLARLAPLSLGTTIGLAFAGQAAIGWPYAAEFFGLGASVLVLGLGLDYLMVRLAGRKVPRAKLLLVPRHAAPLLLVGPEGALRSWVEAWSAPMAQSASELGPIQTVSHPNLL